MMRLVGSLIILAAATIGFVLMSHPWSGEAEPAGPVPPENDPPVLVKKAFHDQFAADRDSGFDSLLAMSYLKKICKIGPRISGSNGMKQQQELLKKHFEALGAKVTFQRFTARQKSQHQPVAMANLIVSWHPQRQRRVILCTHYDTRPIADREPDRRRWHDEFLGANDGGSGVALLMEMGNLMKHLQTKVGVDFVFFDGEEYIFDPRKDGDQYFFGSGHFAQNYKNSRPSFRYVAAVLLDMIAGKNPHFLAEAHSWFSAPALVRDIWKIAGEEKCTAFTDQIGESVDDDHLALNRAGIRAVDIIDFHYTHWHRLSDIPENCFPEGLVQVARVLTVWLQHVK